MRPRQIAQIAACAAASDVSHGDNYISAKVFALCTDGTVWQCETQPYNGRVEWAQLPPIPTEEK